MTNNDINNFYSNTQVASLLTLSAAFLLGSKTALNLTNIINTVQNYFKICKNDWEDYKIYYLKQP